MFIVFRCCENVRDRGGLPCSRAFFLQEDRVPNQWLTKGPAGNALLAGVCWRTRFWGIDWQIIFVKPRTRSGFGGFGGKVREIHSINDGASGRGCESGVS